MGLIGFLGNTVRTITDQSIDGIKTFIKSPRIRSSDNTHFATLSFTGTADKTLDADIITSLQRGTAVATTSGTYVDFTSIPSWAKRITVILNGVSTNGTSHLLIQVGSTTLTTTGYRSSSSYVSSTATSASYSTGFGIANGAAATTLLHGGINITNIASNDWVSFGVFGSYTASTATTGGNISLSNTLDRIRITTVNGTDTFDAGSVNIMYEG